MAVEELNFQKSVEIRLRQAALQTTFSVRVETGLAWGLAFRGFRLMQSEEALTLVTEDLFQQLSNDGVIYAEIRFAPLLHIEHGLCPEGVVEVVESPSNA